MNYRAVRLLLLLPLCLTPLACQSGADDNRLGDDEPSAAPQTAPGVEAAELPPTVGGSDSVSVVDIGDR